MFTLYNKDCRNETVLNCERFPLPYPAISLILQINMADRTRRSRTIGQVQGMWQDMEEENVHNSERFHFGNLYCTK